MTADLILPEKSPFYRDETPQQASARLRAIYDTSTLTGTAKQQADDLAKALKQLADKPARRKMCIGVALLGPAAQPIFAGVNAENVVSVGSIAKLALLYAAFQLRADVGVIATSDGVADSGDRAERVTSLADAVQTAFKQAKDPGLQAIGRTPLNLPRLARIFDLASFLNIPSKKRLAHLLDFTSGFPENTEPDELPFDTRLRKAISESNNTMAMSCICDVCLTYIQALLKRTGLASLHGGKPGLWLAWLYGDPGELRRPPITGLGARYYSKITTGASAGKWVTTEPPTGDKTVPKKRPERSGHVATTLGLATLLTLLDREHLFGKRDSCSMMNNLTLGGWLAGGFRDSLGQGAALAKVGILKPVYSECALVESTALRKQVGEGSSDARAGSPRTSAPPLPTTTWIAVGLNAQGHPANDDDDNGVLEDLGRDLAVAVASIVRPS